MTDPSMNVADSKAADAFPDSLKAAAAFGQSVAALAIMDHLLSVAIGAKIITADSVSHAMTAAATEFQNFANQHAEVESMFMASAYHLAQMTLSGLAARMRLLEQTMSADAQGPKN
jgi:hypothetical protein